MGSSCICVASKFAPRVRRLQYGRHLQPWNRRIQADPDTIYTVFAYNHKTRKIVIAPLGE